MKSLRCTVILAAILLAESLLTGAAASALGPPAQGDTIPQRIIYKRIDTVALYMDVFTPQDAKGRAPRPAMVFFFGGGWRGGTTRQFEPQANYFAGRGMVCFLVDYRVAGRHGSTPFESLMDAKSAIRYIKANAATLGVDTSRIVAAGGSAGGHLAAATALISEFNDPRDDLSISPRPAALVLFNPVIDNSKQGYGYGRLGERYRDFSPLHNMRPEAPPTIFFLGTQDKIIPVETARRYKEAMEASGNRCELILYENQEHGFFNHKNPEFYRNTVYETDRFLRSLKLLRGKPTILRGTPGQAQP